ncbi:MAG: hypothetical protein PHP83_03530, partial [Clostridia bacterium]|nr:hypothetical protein [Clostridia bacterium]
KGVIKSKITEQKIDEMITESYKALTSNKDEANKKIKEEKTKMETKTLKLTSLNTTEYPDKEIDCVVVDDMKQYATAYVEYLSSKGKYPQKAKKTSVVEARLGLVGEEVDTRPRVQRDGKIYVIGETKGKVKVEGSMIVKNPDGEEYVVKPEAFSKKYKKTEKDGWYEPIAEPIEYVVLQQDIAFKAPWGEDMFGVKGAAINISNLDDIYAIQNEAFNKTYTPSDVKECVMCENN